MKQINSSCSPSLETDCTSMLNVNQRHYGCLTAGDANAGAFLTGLLDRRTKLGTHVVACHGEQTLCRLSRGATRRKRSVGPTEYRHSCFRFISTAAGAWVSITRRRQRSARTAWREGPPPWPGRARPGSYAVGNTHREAQFSRSAATNVPIEPPRPEIISKRRSTSPGDSELPVPRIPASRNAKWKSDCADRDRRRVKALAMSGGRPARD